MANPTRVRTKFYALRRYRGGFVVQEMYTDTLFQSGEVTERSGPIMEPDFEPTEPLRIDVDPLGLTADELGEALQFLTEDQVKGWRNLDPRKGSYFGKYMTRFRDFNKTEEK